MIGIDIIEIDRFQRALSKKPRLKQRIFLQAELDYAYSQARPIQHLAARFCAKEAVAKVLGLNAWSFKDIEIDSSLGQPQVKLTGKLSKPISNHQQIISVSLTHSRNIAGAVALSSARSPANELV